MKKSLIFILGPILLCVGSMHSFAETVKLATSTVGELSVEMKDADGWKICGSVESAGQGQEVVTIRLSNEHEATPAKLSVKFNVPLVDMSHIWFPYNADKGLPMKPEWSLKPESQIARDMPLISCLNDDNTNRLTFACSDPFHYIKFQCGVVEEGTLYGMRMHLFTEQEAPVKDYTVKLLLDTRDVFWSESIEQASAWMTKEAAITPCHVPEAAFQPLYSSWYQFHQGVHAPDIEEECRLASGMGMKTLILDDGWQTEDGKRGYAYCGDWKVCKSKFPDMKAHVDAVHKSGMKYMVWYSVPFIGIHAEAYPRFKGKYLQDTGDNRAVLDPRFPEVREYLVNVFETAMKEWGIDGFKLDFIDQFRIYGTDSAIAENYAGRDIKSLTDAVDVLMKEILSRLSAINPDVLIEFRQRYIGPAIRQYGNMLRASDCPADGQTNRVRCANLRLTSGNSAVHSDMIEWNLNEPPQVAARQILSSIFFTVQYSVMLRDITPEQKKMMTHWIAFSQKHKQALLHGEFKPYFPQFSLPLLEAGNAEERIFALYQPGMCVRVEKEASRSYIINATPSDEIIVNFGSRPAGIKIFDTFGQEVKTGCGKERITPGKPAVLAIPQSGYAEIFH